MKAAIGVEMAYVVDQAHIAQLQHIFPINKSTRGPLMRVVEKASNCIMVASPKLVSSLIGEECDHFPVK